MARRRRMDGKYIFWTRESGSDPPQSWEKIPDPILHIELRRWADLVLIAPCSANTLAKLAGGLCDNLATNLLRALPPISPQQNEPLLSDSLAGANKGIQVWVFPAMNTLMYEHPLTAAHLKTVTDTLKYRVEGPIG
jgi:phosphopantothenoylcysteine decarboxylase